MIMMAGYFPFLLDATLSRFTIIQSEVFDKLIADFRLANRIKDYPIPKHTRSISRNRNVQWRNRLQSQSNGDGVKIPSPLPIRGRTPHSPSYDNHSSPASIIAKLPTATKQNMANVQCVLVRQWIPYATIFELPWRS